MRSKKKVALITGITGQDGSYLTELLLKNLGWQAKTSLEKGIKLTIKNFEKEFKNKSIRL